MLSSKFSVGDPAYFDDARGEVLEVRQAHRSPDAYNIYVQWDNGVKTLVWESDLLSQREYDDFYGKGQ